MIAEACKASWRSRDGGCGWKEPSAAWWWWLRTGLWIGLDIDVPDTIARYDRFLWPVGWNGITPGEFLIYKKVYGVRRDCMPCTHQPAGAISPYPEPVPVNIPLAGLELLAACAVVRLFLPDGCGSLVRKPTLRLWYGTGSPITYRLRKCFFVQGLISYRGQYLTGIPNPSQVIPIHIWEYKSFILSKYSMVLYIHIPYIVCIYYNILNFPDSQIKRHTLYGEK